MQRLDLQFCGRQPTEAELDACSNCLRMSKHTRMRLMPNHQLDEKGNLTGFLFTCNQEDKASILPMSDQMFSTTAVYEIKGHSTTNFHRDAMRIMSNIDESKRRMQALVTYMRSDTRCNALFDCIGEQNDLNEGYAVLKVEDQRAWADEIPGKMGVYHTFSRSYANDQREHRLFIVISGYLVQAAEQLQNLWLDCGNNITCKDFVMSEEVDWLRRATLRSLNRVAAKFAEVFSLNIHTVIDTEDPDRRRMALPSLVTRHNDIDVKYDVRLVNNACLTDKMDSGVIFDLFGAEGMWVFLGPRNTNEYGVFGSMFAHRAEAQAFPTRTVRYNKLFTANNQGTRVKVRADRTSDVVVHDSLQNAVCNDQVLYNEYMIPDERFYRITENLGYNRNDGILNIMPIICYVTDEPLQIETDSAP